MIGFYFVEDLICIDCAVGIHQHFEIAFAFSVDGIPLMKELIFGKFVDEANELARLKILCVVAFLEIVQFLENRYRDADIVFVKIEDGVVFINYY